MKLRIDALDKLCHMQSCSGATTSRATAALVVEVAVSSVEVDRAKADVYAEAGVAAYWLVLAEFGKVEVYSQPSPGGYAHTEMLSSGDSLETWYGVPLPIAELFT